ncbi:MAG TPA: GAF domain-containing protein [Chroococcidiopsis sp.]
MLPLLKSLFSPSSYIPHGHCYLWQTPLVWLHLTSDALIAIAYFSIPVMLIYFVSKRRDVPFSNVFVMFGAFIVLCGLGHLLDIWTLWHPAYWLSGVERALTALVSCYTALRLVELLPQFLALKTPAYLEGINRQLEAEIEQRKQAEQTLRQIVSSTAALTGEEFFSVLVRDLASALGVSYALVSEIVDESAQTLNPLAFWVIDDWANAGAYTMSDVPCGVVVNSREVCYFTQNLQSQFPESTSLKKLAAVSYVGVPLLDKDQRAIGTLCIIDTKPIPDSENTRAIMTVFGARASAELQRKWAENAKRRLYEELEVRVQERTAELIDSNDALAVEVEERTAAQAQLQRIAERERATSLVIQRMRKSLDLDIIFSATTAELRLALRCDRTLIYRFQPDWSGTVVAESVSPGWNAIIPIQTNDPELSKIAVDQADCIVRQLDGTEVILRDTYLQTTSGGIYQDKTSYCCVPDVGNAGFDPCYLELLNSLQAQAYITVPIFCQKQLWGLLAVYQNAGPRKWLESEIQMVSQIGNQLGIAVQQAELFAQTQQQADELRYAKNAADAANRAKSEFLASMSHELRTPLNVILGLTQLLDQDRGLNADQRRYVEIISRSGEHLLTLINDVLEMSKIEAGRLNLNEDSLNLHALLDDVKEMLQVRTLAKGLQFDVQYGASLPLVIKTDGGKLRQILINLIGNAIKFTRQGHVTVRVSYQRLDEPEAIAPAGPNAKGTLSQAGLPLGRLFVEVEDTGSGISSEEIGSLFRPFEQASVGRQSMEGTGLGLAISQRYVQQMSGEITVRSQPGEGSVFAFSIVVGVVDTSQIQTSVADTKTDKLGKVIGLTPGQPTYRLLIAEDHPVNRLLLVKLLEFPGFEIRQAENGREAIALWESWNPDLIFMDMQMPVMNGYDATRTIRAQEVIGQDSGAVYSPTGLGDRPIEPALAPRSRTKIIALTASAFKEQRQEILMAGCDDFISKPFKRDELFEKIAVHLGVQYLYEESAPHQNAAHSPQSVQTMQALDHSMLAQMPADWLQRLHQAALQGNDVWIIKLIADLPPEQAIAAQVLHQLAEDFQFDQIIAITQQFQRNT